MVSREAPLSRPGDVVYASLWTPDVERAARFYTAVLGWSLTSADGGRGRLVDGGPPLGIHAHDGRPTTMLCHAVPDVDVAVDLVRAAGGGSDGAVDEPHGRTALCVDDHGLPFALATAGPAPHGGGDLAYVEIRVPDAGRARAFYATVLGWRFTPGAQAGYWHPAFADGTMTRPVSGLVGGHPEPAVVPTFRVPDVAAAATAVRAAGGMAADPTDSRHGVIAECADDQDAPFLLTDG
jgi:predicted enzyme related to lactoylglutathione lyase